MTPPSEIATNCPELPFASSELEKLGVRVTRAEFSRLMGCSRQAVSDWVRAGRIVVGTDGRFDPRQAVRSLLATGDPSKIRARVLQPLYAEMTELRTALGLTESRLKAAQEDCEFHAGAAAELIDLFDRLCIELSKHWQMLAAAENPPGHHIITEWLLAGLKHGSASSLPDIIQEPPRAPDHGDGDGAA